MSTLYRVNKHVVRIAAVSVILVFVVFGASALANTENGTNQGGDVGGLKKAQRTTQPALVRLEGSKLRACENRERVINRILDKIATRGERRLNVYTKIFERVQNFYTEKQLSVANYSELVASVNAKKEVAQTAVNLIKDKQIEFACDGTDPKGSAASFKADLKAEIEALHAYQQVLKDFIVAVKTSIGDQNNE